MKETFKEKMNNFKENHPKLVKVTKKVLGVVALGGAAGLIGYAIGSQTGFCPTDLTDGSDETDFSDEVLFEESVPDEQTDEVADKEVSD